MASISTATILFAATCLLLAVSALPSSGPTSLLTTMPSLKANEGRCIRNWNHPYCKQFSDGGYDLFLPNARGHTNIYQAFAEFNDFIPLLNSNCSEKLGVLLCFLYFPSCGQNKAVKPCKSLCEEVTDPDGECTHIMRTVVSPTGCLGKGVVWPDHLKCNTTINPFTTASTESEPIYAEEQPCAPGLDAGEEYKKNPWIPEIHDRSNGRSKCKPTEPPTEPPTTQPPTTQQTTQPPHCTPENCSSGKKINLRTSVNSKSFFAKNQYTFAFRAVCNNFTTYNCKHAANCTVLEQYSLKAAGDCTRAPTITTNHVLVLGSHNDSSCTNCFEENLQAGKEYIVAGVHQEDTCLDNATTFHVSCESKSTSLIARTTPKILKNVIRFINEGNEERGCAD